MSIPKDRPVIWRDLEDLRQRFGLNNGTLAEIFGLPTARWNREIRENFDQPVKEVPVAILARIYDQHPDLLPIAAKPDMREVYDFLNSQRDGGGEPIQKRHFSILFGRNSSAGYSWLDQSKPTSAPIDRIIASIKKSPAPYKVLQEMAETEARARNVDPWKTGRWTEKRGSE